MTTLDKFMARTNMMNNIIPYNATSSSFPLLYCTYCTHLSETHQHRRETPLIISSHYAAYPPLSSSCLPIYYTCTETRQHRSEARLPELPWTGMLTHWITPLVDYRLCLSYIPYDTPYQSFFIGECLRWCTFSFNTTSHATHFSPSYLSLPPF